MPKHFQLAVTQNASVAHGRRPGLTSSRSREADYISVSSAMDWEFLTTEAAIFSRRPKRAADDAFCILNDNS
jgi:hypothetical protein